MLIDLTVPTASAALAARDRVEIAAQATARDERGQTRPLFAEEPRARGVVHRAVGTSLPDGIQAG
jgi:hypothetical protein